MSKKIQRIAILGCGGSGKTTLAKRLAPLFSLPIFHLDQYYWQAGWVEPNLEEYTSTHQNICSQEQWIIDGTQTRFMHDRLPLADIIIFIDRPRLVCLWRVFKRWFIFKNKNRSDLPPTCKERLTWGFIRYILLFNNYYRPKVIDLLNQLKTTIPVYVLTTDNQIKDYLASIEKISNKKTADSHSFEEFLQKYRLP